MNFWLIKNIPHSRFFANGNLAAKHLLPEGASYEQLISAENNLSTDNMIFLVTQSLNELLLNPLQKKSMLKISKILAASFKLN